MSAAYGDWSPYERSRDGMGLMRLHRQQIIAKPIDIIVYAKNSLFQNFVN
jgi:hypothetical protein